MVLGCSGLWPHLSRGECIITDGNHCQERKAHYSQCKCTQQGIPPGLGILKVSVRKPGSQGRLRIKQGEKAGIGKLFSSEIQNVV